MNSFLKKFTTTLIFSIILLPFPLWLYTCQDVRAYENSECVVCHKDYGRSPETIPENVSKLYIDQEKWEKDIHYEVAGLSCDDCHLDATPETHPEGGLQKVNCGECHDEEAESYYQTVHWTAEVGEGKQKPDCGDCHPPHATLPQDNPESAVFKGKIKAVCLSCHQERVPSTSLLNRLAVFRISAHRKSDISNRFDPSECINCHYIRTVGHGDNPLTETHCGQCHDMDAKTRELVFGPFHLDPSLKNQHLVFSVEVLNIIIILSILIAFIVLVIRGFVKSKNTKAAQQNEG